MPTAISAQGTTFKISSGSGGAVTLTSVAVGYPTILGKAAHGFSNGDVVALALFAGADAALLNGMTAVVRNVLANSFAIDIDTTGKTITTNTNTATATSNTYTKISGMKDFSGFDGTASEIDTTDLDSTAKEFISGLQDNGMFTANMNSLLDDAGQIALLAAKVSGVVHNWKLTLPNGKVASFAGFVKKFGGASAGGVDAVVKVGADIRISGPVTWA